MIGGLGQFLTAWTSRPGPFRCRRGIGGVSYFYCKQFFPESWLFRGEDGI